MKINPILSDEQIFHLWDTRVGEPCSSMPLIDADKEEFARAIEQAVLQSPQVQQWKKDAERWNKWLPWMKNINRKPFGLAVEIREIDAAMEKKP